MGKSPIHKATSHVSSPKLSSSQQLPEFPQVQKLGIQVIGRILMRSGKQEAGGKVNWSLGWFKEAPYSAIKLLRKCLICVFRNFRTTSN